MSPFAAHPPPSGPCSPPAVLSLFLTAAGVVQTIVDTSALPAYVIPLVAGVAGALLLLCGGFYLFHRWKQMERSQVAPEVGGERARVDVPREEVCTACRAALRSLRAASQQQQQCPSSADAGLALRCSTVCAALHFRCLTRPLPSSPRPFPFRRALLGCFILAG